MIEVDPMSKSWNAKMEVQSWVRYNHFIIRILEPPLFFGLDSLIPVWPYGSKNGYGSFRGDPDVWNERVKYKRFDTDLLRRYTLKWHGISTIRHFLVRIKGMRGSCPLEMYGSWVWIGAMDRLWVTTSRKDQHDSLFPASEQVRVTHQSVKATDN